MSFRVPVQVWQHYHRFGLSYQNMASSHSRFLYGQGSADRMHGSWQAKQGSSPVLRKARSQRSYIPCGADVWQVQPPEYLRFRCTALRGLHGQPAQMVFFQISVSVSSLPSFQTQRNVSHIPHFPAPDTMETFPCAASRLPVFYNQSRWSHLLPQKLYFPPKGFRFPRSDDVPHTQDLSSIHPSQRPRTDRRSRFSHSDFSQDLCGMLPSRSIRHSPTHWRWSSLPPSHDNCSAEPASTDPRRFQPRDKVPASAHSRITAECQTQFLLFGRPSGVYPSSLPRIFPAPARRLPKQNVFPHKTRNTSVYGSLAQAPEPCRLSLPLRHCTSAPDGEVAAIQRTTSQVFLFLLQISPALFRLLLTEAPVKIDHCMYTHWSQAPEIPRYARPYRQAPLPFRSFFLYYMRSLPLYCLGQSLRLW